MERCLIFLLARTVLWGRAQTKKHDNDKVDTYRIEVLFLFHYLEIVLNRFLGYTVVTVIAFTIDRFSSAEVSRHTDYQKSSGGFGENQDNWPLGRREALI